ncbi:unnamed protein product [Musa acuminata var. zebrina]
MSSSSSPPSSSRSVSEISSSGSGSCRVEVISSPSAGSSPADSKGFTTLQSLLGPIRDCYSIPEDYKLHAPRPGQRPYDPFPNGCLGGRTVFLATPSCPRMPPLVGDFPVPNGAELLALSGGFLRGMSGGGDRTDSNPLFGMFLPMQRAGRALSNCTKWV